MARRRFDLSDFEWTVIQPLLPNKPRGVPRVDDRRVINGILLRFRTGSPWADVPDRYGPYTIRHLYQSKCEAHPACYSVLSVPAKTRGGVGRA